MSSSWLFAFRGQAIKQTNTSSRITSKTLFLLGLARVEVTKDVLVFLVGFRVGFVAPYLGLPNLGFFAGVDRLPLEL